MVTGVTNSAIRYIDQQAQRIEQSNAKIASGKVYTPNPNNITTYTRAATTDTADLTGITNPDDPNNLSPINVSYNQIGPTSTTTEEGGDVDVAAEVAERSNASTLFAFGIEGQKKSNQLKKHIVDILT